MGTPKKGQAYFIDVNDIKKMIDAKKIKFNEKDPKIPKYQKKSSKKIGTPKKIKKKLKPKTPKKIKTPKSTKSVAKTPTKRKKQFDHYVKNFRGKKKKKKKKKKS